MRRVLRRLALAAASVLAVVLVVASFPLLSSVGLRLLDLTKSAGVTSVPIRAATLGDTGPGSLVSAMTMPAFTRTSSGKHLQAARVVYRSTSGDTGSPTVVSGSVFTPLGRAPQGGWPVIGFGHGTTGIDQPCAPSLSNSLLGMASVVATLTANGYAVAMPDYQGLGSPGVHPYPDPRTAGLNMIDAVRALRLTFKNVSNRWAAVGHSQGGGAAWAADEQAGAYAPDLKLVGAVALAPSADVAGLVDKAQAGTLTLDQRGVVPLIVESLARLHPELKRDDYRHGAAARDWDTLVTCSGASVPRRDAALKGLDDHDLAPGTPAAAERLRRLVKQWALPQRPLPAPLDVVYGDRDTYIDAQWTTDAIARACALGGTVTWDLESGKGHGNVDFSAALRWLADRFADKPAPNECR